ncbi:unnamed protein product, partial [Ixodes persulcatus]
EPKGVNRHSGKDSSPSRKRAIWESGVVLVLHGPQQLGVVQHVQHGSSQGLAGNERRLVGGLCGCSFCKGGRVVHGGGTNVEGRVDQRHLVRHVAGVRRSAHGLVVAGRGVLEHESCGRVDALHTELLGVLSVDLNHELVGDQVLDHGRRNGGAHGAAGAFSRGPKARLDPGLELQHVLGGGRPDRVVEHRHLGDDVGRHAALRDHTFSGRKERG